MNLVLQLMAGVTMAGLAEGMALADRAGLQQKDVLEVLELTSLACPMMIEKSKGTLLENKYRRMIFLLFFNLEKISLIVFFIISQLLSMEVSKPTCLCSICRRT